MKHVTFPLLAGLGALLPTAPAAAQWSTNPATNLSIADRSGEQVLPKLAATQDGGSYVGWFDNSGGSYAVYLQRLDAAGVEQWPHDGILISSQPQSSSLVDWDLIADSTGSCVLTFTDIRAGGDLDVYAYRVASNGTMLWGPNGVAVSNDAEYEANPRVVETTAGNFVVAWSRSLNAGGGSIELQQLDPGGNPLWLPNGVSIPGDPGAIPGFHALVPADNGGVVVAWMRDISFRGNRYIHAQKLDVAGAPQWGATPVAVFDATSLPIAHQLKMVPDGAGGALIAWHFSQGILFYTRLQHLTAAGAERFAHDGVDVSAEANMSKLDPALFHLPARGETVVVFNVRNSAQSIWGVSIQKLDGQGLPLWGPDGVRLATVDTVFKSTERAVPFADGALAFWFEQPAATPPTAIRGARVRGNGQVAWGPIPVSSAIAEKVRFAVDVSPSGVAELAWSDRRRDMGDILVQNVNPNGTLGAALADLRVYGCGVNPAGSMTTAGSAAVGRRIEFRIDNPLGTQVPATSSGLLALSFAPAAGYPCGLQLAGWGMAGPGAVGELLLDFNLLAGPALVGSAWGGPGVPSTVFLDVPLRPELAGASLYAQGVLVDPAPGRAVPVGVTDAVRVRIGF